MAVARIPSVEGGIQPTLLDAKGDLITATANDTPARLGVGANNSMLTADSTASTGLKYSMPASLATNARTASYTLVAADAGTRVTMNSASATTITINTGLFAANDVVQITNLGVGVLTITAGTATVSTAGVLTLAQNASGSLYFTSTGVSIWQGSAAAAASGGANWSLVNSGGTTLSGSATTTISGISAASKIMILVERAGSGTASVGAFVRINTDTSANYYFLGAQLYPGTVYSPNDFDEMYSGGPGFNTSISLARMSSNVASKMSGYILLDGCNSSGVKTFNSIGAGGAASGSSQTHYYLGGYYNSSSAITSVSITTAAAQTFNAGKVFVYTSA